MIRKYPRTRHVTGSRLQVGDEDLEQFPLAELVGRHIVVEEKMDGANCGISFSSDAMLRLQSRGHFLTGGPRERHFDLFKQWANAHVDALFDALGDRYVMYGEWLYAKHTVFYDLLPHYFMEFDVLDLRTGEFLDTPNRSEVLRGLPVVPVKVLFAGTLASQADLPGLLGRSHFISDVCVAQLRTVAARYGLDVDHVIEETDVTGQMEGLYIKVEQDGVARERLKFVRSDFVTTLADANTHWLDRPIVPNQLRPGVDIFQNRCSRDC